MKTIRNAVFLAWLGAGALAMSSHAQNAQSPAPGTQGPATGFTSLQALNTWFEVEGESPYASPFNGTMTFSALRSKYDSGHGHGYRNEVKIVKSLRVPASATNEHFRARVTPTLPNGAKTIVAQYHNDGYDTLLKIYVQDTADKKGLDGKANNGVFDIIGRIAGTDGKEVVTALGTIKSGESFDLDIQLVKGEAVASVNTATNGAIQTTKMKVKENGLGIFFKFGDYLQARDPVTNEPTIEKAKWDAYFQQNGIASSQIVFSQVNFERY